MAEKNTIKKDVPVDLDTDDVKEQDVQVTEPKPQKEDKTVDLNKGEVDLGYTEYVDKDKEKAKILVEEDVKEDVKEEVKEPEPKEKPPAPQTDDLTKISGNVQKRIDKLTHRYREAERRERAALDFAKGLQKKYDHSMDQFKTADQQYLKEFDARVDSQREQVKGQLKDAIASQDADKIMTANDKLTQLAVEKEKARLQIAENERKAKEDKAKQESSQTGRDQLPDQLPQPSDKARAWAEKNEWFGKDKIMTNAAWSIHDDIAGRGIDVDSEEYYTEINRQMKSYFPDRFDKDSTEEKPEPRKPVQTVASAGRKQQGRRTVRLTKSQVAIAKKLGVPLEEYAKFVKEEA